MIITGDDFNTKAMNLYKSIGFVKIGEKQFSYAYLSIFKLDFQTYKFDLQTQTRYKS